MSTIPTNDRRGLLEAHAGLNYTVLRAAHAENAPTISAPSVSSVGQFTDRTSMADSQDDEHRSTVTTPTAYSVSTRYGRASSVFSSPSIWTRTPEMPDDDQSVSSTIHHVDAETPLGSQIGKEKRIHTLERLQKMGFDVMKKSSDARKAILRCVKEDDENAVALLLEDLTVLDARDEGGKTPLYLAVEKGNHSMVRLVLKHGDKYIGTFKPRGSFRFLLAERRNIKEIPDTMPGKELRPVHVAAKRGDTDILTSLIDAGASVESRTSRGFQPIHIATIYDQVAAVQALLERGVDLEASNSGYTALHYAGQYSCKAVAKLLIDRGASIEAKTLSKTGSTPLHSAAQNNDAKDILYLLLDKGADIEARDPQSCTALHRSAALGHVNIVTALLIRGADIEAKGKLETPHSSNISEATPLHFAAAQGRTDVVSLLMSRGANIEATTKGGNTPLYIAAEWGHIAVMTVLLDRGADIERKDKYLHTPLVVAAYNGQLKALTLLLDRGADVNAKNSDGYTALKWAKKAGHKDTVDLLLKWGART